MAEVTLEVPRLLADAAGGETLVSLSADRLSTACAEVRRRWPVLATHVFDERGNMRPHVLLLHNDRCTRWIAEADFPLQGGDRLTILQAVSGG